MQTYKWPNRDNQVQWWRFFGWADLPLSTTPASGELEFWSLRIPSNAVVSGSLHLPCRSFDVSLFVLARQSRVGTEVRTTDCCSPAALAALCKNTVRHVSAVVEIGGILLCPVERITAHSDSQHRGRAQQRFPVEDEIERLCHGIYSPPFGPHRPRRGWCRKAANASKFPKRRVCEVLHSSPTAEG